VLRGEWGSVMGRIENLSLGGTLVRTDERDPLDVLDVELRLPQSRWISVPARVVRPADGERIAVAFTDLSADAEDAIEDEIVGSLAAARARPVLVIDGAEERREEIAAALRARAMTPLVPRTPLEVVGHLLGAERVELCVVSTRFGDLRGGEVAGLIAELCPWMRVLDSIDDAPRLAQDAAAAWEDIEGRAW
jgi:hypothetical protein